MPVWRMKAFLGYGGAADRDLWSNTFHTNLNHNLESPEMTAAVGRLAAAYPNVTLTSVSLRRIVVDQIAFDPGTLPNKAFRTFEYNLAGARAVPAGTEALDANFALIIRRETQNGRSGRIFLRGALTTGDVEVQANGLFKLTNPVAFQEPGWVGNMAAFANAPGGEFKMVIPQVGVLNIGTMRNVTVFRPGGVTHIKLNHRRRAKKGVFDSLLSSVQKRINKAASIVQQYGGIGSIPAAVLPIFEALRAEITQGLAALPAPVRATLALPGWLS